MSARMTVELKELRFFAYHGWHEEEAKTGNEFEINIIASFPVKGTSIISIDETINYAEMYKIVKKEFAIPEKLLETCAMKIAEQIYIRFPQLEQIQISIRKLNAPITNFIGCVGITYTKEFK